MPWYTYVCEKCGEMVQQKTSLAHREVMPVHRGGGGCGDGRLRRVQPALGPGDTARGPARRTMEVVKDGAAGGSSHDVTVRTADPAAAHACVPATPPADLGPSWEDCVLETLSTIMTESLTAPRRVELIRRLLATLPSLSLKLRVVETVANSGGTRPEAAAAVDALAAEIAAAPLEVLARERRLLDLLLLATRHAKLGIADIGRRLTDDRVMVRLLRSAIRWTAEGGEDAAEPPFLAWSDLRQLAGGPLLRARILQLAARPGTGDAWDRLVIAAAAEGEPDRNPGPNLVA
jgi:hypothetical protein